MIRKQAYIVGIVVLSFLSTAPSTLEALSLSKKRAHLNENANGSNEASQATLQTLNRELTEARSTLNSTCQTASSQVAKLIETQAPQSTVAELTQSWLREIQSIQLTIAALEAKWKTAAESSLEQDIDALWHQPDTTIGQLVIDYGSSNYVYVIPPEIAGLKIHISSQLSVPKALWGEMLELILAGYGIGIKEINPFLRQLFFIRLNNSGLISITDSREELSLLPEDAKVAFLFTPEVTDVRRITQFLDKFAPQEQVSVQQMGGSVLLIGPVRELSELLKIASFITTPKMSNTWRLITLQKASAEEMERMLSALFENNSGGASGGHNDKIALPVLGGEQIQGLKVVLLKQPAQSLFLVGTKDLIDKAVKIIEEVEASFGDVQERTIYWYACRNSEADELAKVLSQVYTRLLGTTAPSSKSSSQPTIRVLEQKKFPPSDPQPGTVVTAPPLIAPASPEKTKSGNLNENFIVDPKTNSIVMVVENYVLPKLKELIRKLDVPKQMVQIDVLLFEKRIGNSSSFGMNLLRMGSSASKKHRDSLTWNEHHRDDKYDRHDKHHKHHRHDRDNRDRDRNDRGGDKLGTGILEYVISRGTKGTFMPFDLAFQFLLTQEDIQINANPSVTTVNQTPAKIAVVDQISINTGAVEFDRDHFKDAYTRAEYGITIQITPTVHAKVDDEENRTDEQKFITLSTDIIFDTTKSDKHDRPSVTRRNIKNEVRVANGESVIIGGLRRKTQGGEKESIPFLGELPGIGKLFSSTVLSTHSTEMFVFITPRIVPDAREEMHKLRREDLLKRPGDTPEFLREVEEARQHEKRELFERSLEMLFKTPDEIQ